VVGCSQKFKYIQIQSDSYKFIYSSLLQAVFVGGSTVFAPSTLWLFNIAMENGPFIDGLPGFTY
jgi:hypothetical protein